MGGAGLGGGRAAVGTGATGPGLVRAGPLLPWVA